MFPKVQRFIVCPDGPFVMSEPVKPGPVKSATKELPVVFIMIRLTAAVPTLEFVVEMAWETPLIVVGIRIPALAVIDPETTMAPAEEIVKTGAAAVVPPPTVDGANSRYPAVVVFVSMNQLYCVLLESILISAMLFALGEVAPRIVVERPVDAPRVVVPVAERAALTVSEPSRTFWSVPV
jgi:hypothetical protein